MLCEGKVKDKRGREEKSMLGWVVWYGLGWGELEVKRGWR